MNIIQTIPGTTFVPGKLLFGSPARSNYVWKNIIIEKRISVNWAYRLYKGSIFDAFWTVLSSPLS